MIEESQEDISVRWALLNCRPCLTIKDIEESRPPRWSCFWKRKTSEKAFMKFMEWSSMLYSKGYTRMHEVHSIVWKAICEENCNATWNNLLGEPTSLTRDKFINDFIENFPSWKSIKKIVFDRDGNKCRNCDNNKSLEAHHLKRVKFGGISTEENLITLCKSCHKKEEKL